MQYNNLKPRTKNKKVMIVGRGGRRGKTSGRGGKGQTARAGNKRRPELRDFIKRIPKLRGRGVSPQKSFAIQALAINVGTIESAFKAGDIVSPKTLLGKKVISTYEGRSPQVKILANGELTKKLSFENCTVSKEARVKIEKAGGVIK